MENQHRMISGYRDLSVEEITLMNEAKALASAVGEFCDRLERMPRAHPADPAANPEPVAIDARWLAIGRTDLQRGFMSLIRSVAKPTTF